MFRNFHGVRATTTRDRQYQQQRTYSYVMDCRKRSEVNWLFVPKSVSRRKCQNTNLIGRVCCSSTIEVVLCDIGFCRVGGCGKPSFVSQINWEWAGWTSLLAIFNRLMFDCYIVSLVLVIASCTRSIPMVCFGLRRNCKFINSFRSFEIDSMQ